MRNRYTITCFTNKKVPLALSNLLQTHGLQASFFIQNGHTAPLPALIVGVSQLHGGKWALVKLLFPEKSEFMGKATYVQW